MTQSADDGPDLDELSQRLLELLEEQRDCYRRLKGFADRQRRLITDQDPEPLLKLLADRQGLIDRLGELNKALHPFRQEWANTYTQMKSERRQHVQVVLDDINTLLGSILITDAEDSRLLAASREDTLRQMQGTAAGRLANSAYAAHAYRTSGSTAADHEA